MKFDCIIPAAGLSERMGCWKLFLEYKGKTIIEHSIQNSMKNSSQLIISGGYRFADLRKKIESIENVLIVENKDYEQGMITSIKAALPFVKTDKFFIALSDMPLVPPEVFYKMSRIDFSHVLFPVYNGRRGHPVLVSSILKNEILNASPKTRMKDILGKFPVSEIEIGNSNILFDIDTQKDYQKLLDT